MIAFNIAFPAYADARYNNNNFIAYLLIPLIIFIVVFLLLREVMCWYWKINERIALLTEINDFIKTQKTNTNDFSKSIYSKPETITNNFSKPSYPKPQTLQELKSAAGEDAINFAYTTETEWVCICGTHNLLDKSKQFQNCTKCHRNKNHVLTEYPKKT